MSIPKEIARETSPDLQRDIQRPLACAQAAIEKNAENVRVLDLTAVSAGFTDYFMICSAISDRQVQTIADSVQKKMKDLGSKLISIEGYAEGRWVLLDFGDVIVHVFLDALREYYNLETLWADAPRVAIPSEFFGPGASSMRG